MSMKPQSIKRASKMLPVPKDDYVVWDDVLSQLGRRIRKSRETWIVQTRVEGKTKRRTRGACGEIKVEVARVLAQTYIDELCKTAVGESGDITLAEFAERFLEDCSGQWKPATLKGHRHNLSGQILPFFGTRRHAGIGRGDVLDWQRGLAPSDRQTQAAPQLCLRGRKFRFGPSGRGRAAGAFRFGHHGGLCAFG